MIGIALFFGRRSGTAPGSDHTKAQELLAHPDTRVDFVRVCLGTAESRSDKNNILRHYEEQQYQKQKAAGFQMTNEKGIQGAGKKTAAEDLIKKHGASAGDRENAPR